MSKFSNFRSTPRLRGFACETHTRDLKSHTRDLRFQNLTRESHARDLIVFLWYPTSVTRDFRNQDVILCNLKKLKKYEFSFLQDKTNIKKHDFNSLQA